MRRLYEQAAKKRTISVRLNADLYARAKQAGLNVSQVAEDGLAQALLRRLGESVKAEIRQDLEAYNAYVAEHGSPADLLREWAEPEDEDAWRDL
jgi:antitoxin CcdA